MQQADHLQKSVLFRDQIRTVSRPRTTAARKPSHFSSQRVPPGMACGPGRAGTALASSSSTGPVRSPGKPPPKAAGAAGGAGDGPAAAAGPSPGSWDAWPVGSRCPRRPRPAPGGSGAGRRADPHRRSTGPGLGWSRPRSEYGEMVVFDLLFCDYLRPALWLDILTCGSAWWTLCTNQHMLATLERAVAVWHERVGVRDPSDPAIQLAAASADRPGLPARGFSSPNDRWFHR